MFSPRPQLPPGFPVLLALAILALGWMIYGQAGRRPGAHYFSEMKHGAIDWTVSPMDRAYGDWLKAPETSWARWDGEDFLRAEPGQALWQRVTIFAPAEAAMVGVVADTYLYSDVVECYVEAPGKTAITPLRSGEKIPAAEKPLAGREAAFPVNLKAGEVVRLYVRTIDRYPAISQLVWWPHLSDFMASRAHDVLAEGGYFGLWLTLLFYNFGLWTRLRFPDTGRYLLYLLFTGVFMFISRNELLVLGIPFGAPWLEVITTVLVSLSAIALVDFAAVFLDLPVSAPRWNRVAQAAKRLMVLFIGVGIAMPWLSRSELIYAAIAAGMLTQVILLGAAVEAWRNGVGQSRHFVAAFGAFMLGLVPSFYMWNGGVRSSDIAVAGYAMLAGSAVELLLFSLATADRFAGIARENLAAKEKLLAEAEQRKALQEAYADELEWEVRERTSELIEANQDKDRMISVIGHDLRSPLTGLTQAAEQLKGAPPSASLDRFLGDTVQTGRQLLLLIEDLVLWARLRAGSVERGAHPVSMLVDPVAALHRTLAEQRGLELEVTAASRVRVSTDLVLAQTLLRNLLANAVKFARQRVVMRAVPEAGGLVVTVQDDGPGLPEAVAAQFSDGAPVACPAQGGMGLRLCLEVAAALDLRIEVTVSPGAGTCFMFTLPMVAEGESV